jgi:hypothetical protein
MHDYRIIDDSLKERREQEKASNENAYCGGAVDASFFR